jgi:hypothetical protein
MPDKRWARCKGCGRHRDAAGEMSWTGLCTVCSTERFSENVLGLHTMSGPAVARWRRGMAASVGAVLVDDLLAGG